MLSHRCLSHLPSRLAPAAARAMLASLALATSALTAGPVLAAGGSEPRTGGSGLRAGEAPWPRWQGRVSLTEGRVDASAGARLDPSGADATSLQSLSLLGDYYFTQQGLVPSSAYSGGFRASGGLIVGSRRAVPGGLLPGGFSGLGSGFSAERRSLGLVAPALALDGSDASPQSVPYLGIGYTGLQSLRGTGGGWGFSADVGVMALQPRSAVRLGQQSIGDTVRGLEISPLLQLGVSYSF